MYEKGLRVRFDRQDWALINRLAEIDRMPKNQVLRLAIRHYAEARDAARPSSRRRRRRTIRAGGQKLAT